MDLYDRILGSLIGAAAGDAMGAATEGRSADEIRRHFNGKVTDLIAPPMDTFGAGNKAGGYTDDFSSAYFVADEIVKNGGVVDEEALKRALVNWSEHAVFFDRFAGPTTRLAIKKFKGEKVEASPGTINSARKATNGSAMRIAPVGLIDAGDVDQAIEDAIKVSELTHNNTLALSGAAAVAAAVAMAVTEDADLYDVIEAGVYGAEKGEAIGLSRKSFIAGPSVAKRIRLSSDIAFGGGSRAERLTEISDIIGTGLHISEAVPSAFGIIAICRGNAYDAVVESANIGYDTDTIGTMAGGIAGALCGSEVFPQHFLPVMEEVNGLGITDLAGRIFDLKVRETGGRGNEK